MPNVEFMAPWFRSEALNRSMSHDTWETLSPHAQRISRYIVAERGETIPGAGINHPRRAERERILDEALATMEPARAAEWRHRG